MGKFSTEEIKKIVKGSLKVATLPIAITIGSVIAVIIILSSAVYFLTVDDGTYKEGDWTSTPYVASVYNNGLKITTDGKIASTYALQELWNEMEKNNSRVSLYLNGPRELLQFMYAELVTQLPDLREDTSKIKTLEEWQEEFENMTESEEEYETFHSSVSGSNSSGDFTKYDLSDTELKGLAAVAYREQGSAIGAAAEASLMANRYEIYGSGHSSIVDYVLNSGWFASGSTNGYYSGANSVPEDVLVAVKGVLVDGQRTLPKYVDEHDCISDISYATNDGVVINVNDRSEYIKNKTIIHNIYDSTYTFYCFPTEASDPFGYISEENREKYGDYSAGTSTEDNKGVKTNLQGGIIRISRNLVTGESTATDEEIKKLETDYETYKDDYETKERERIKNLIIHGVVETEEEIREQIVEDEEEKETGDAKDNVEKTNEEVK